MLIRCKSNLFALLLVATPQMGESAPAVHPFIEAERESGTAVQAEPLSIQEAASLKCETVVEITLRERAEAANDRIFLADFGVCDDKGSNSKICEEARAIDFGAAPEAGRTTRLTKSAVLDTLKREWPGCLVRGVGSEIVQITTPAVEVDKVLVEEALGTALEAYLQSNNLKDTRLIVDRFAIVSPQKVRPGGEAVRFPELEQVSFKVLNSLLYNNVGTILLKADLYNEVTLSTQRLMISAQIHVERKATIVTRDIGPGETLSADDLGFDWVAQKLAQRSVTSHGAYRPSSNGILNASQIVGRRTKRAIRMGSAIEPEFLEKITTVERGELVSFVFRAGEIAVSGKVEALAAGGPGEVIAVLNRETKKKLQARVIAKGQVEAL